VRDHPSSARARILLAEIDLRGGRDPVELLARVEPFADEPTLNPRERFRAASLAAWIQMARGEFLESQRRFREALAFDGESRELQEGLVRALVGAVDRSTPTDARAMSEEALAILNVMIGNAEPGDDLSELEILIAQSEFARGRAILDGPPGDDEERQIGRESVQAALARLRRLSESEATAPEIRRRSRVVAGGIQLYRGNFQAAENHFRAALGTRADSEAKLGLLAALIGGFEIANGSAEEARELIRELESSSEPDPRLADLRIRFDRLTQPPPSPPR